jgi:hypothetical protein
MVHAADSPPPSDPPLMMPYSPSSARYCLRTDHKRATHRTRTSSKPTIREKFGVHYGGGGNKHLPVPQVQDTIGESPKVNVVRDDDHGYAVLAVQLQKNPHNHVTVPGVEVACPEERGFDA